MSLYGYRRPGDLPQLIPLFPLNGVLLLPRSGLPLNIFEPRYLNMVDDALGGSRVIGMIQPDGHGHGAAPSLQHVGTVGRITTFAETEDGRYLITLTGICRFRVEQELNALTPYRQAQVDYEDFANDLQQPGYELIDRDRLLPLLRAYADKRGYKFDWSPVEDAPSEALVNGSATLIPFDPSAKQALLEAQTLQDRCTALIALLETSGAGPSGPMQ